jgi:hypothetical protein
MYPQSKYQYKNISEFISVEFSLLLSLYALKTYSALQLLLSKYKEVYRNKVINNLMPRTLFSLPSTCGIWAADDIHQTTMQSPLTFTHLCLHHTKVCIPAQKKSVSGVCMQEVTFSKSVVAANFLPATCFLRGQKI